MVVSLTASVWLTMTMTMTMTELKVELGVLVVLSMEDEFDCWVLVLVSWWVVCMV